MSNYPVNREPCCACKPDPPGASLFSTTPSTILPYLNLDPNQLMFRALPFVFACLVPDESDVSQRMPVSVVDPTRSEHLDEDM